MRRRFFPLSLLSASAMFSQSPPQSLPKPSASVTSGPRPVVGVVAVRLASGSYVAHAAILAPQGLAVYRNGLRMAQGLDYALDKGVIVPIGSWSIDDTVVLDFWL